MTHESESSNGKHSRAYRKSGRVRTGLYAPDANTSQDAASAPASAAPGCDPEHQSTHVQKSRMAEHEQSESRETESIRVHIASQGGSGRFCTHQTRIHREQPPQLAPLQPQGRLLSIRAAMVQNAVTLGSKDVSHGKRKCSRAYRASGLVRTGMHAPDANGLRDCCRLCGLKAGS